jgi:hypothetical protein
MKKLSTYESQKVYSGINETIRLIQKENKYSYDLRKHDYVERLENHLNKLYKMIEIGEIF